MSIADVDVLNPDYKAWLTARREKNNAQPFDTADEAISAAGAAAIELVEACVAASPVTAASPILGGRRANDKQVGGDHYKTKAIQPWDYIAENDIGYFEGTAIKYLTRWKDKGGVDDLRKAIHFIEKLIEKESA